MTQVNFTSTHEMNLGFFDPGSPPVVFGGRHRTHTNLGSTRDHELSHWDLTVNTSFGLLTLALGTVAKHPGPWPTTRIDRDELVEVNDRLVEVSWNTHEGYAVCREIVQAAAAGRLFKVADLPEDYQAALALVTTPFVSVADPFVSFYLTQALCLSAMNTSLPQFIDGVSILELTAELLDNSDWPPDHRLSSIVDVLARRSGARPFDGVADELYAIALSFRDRHAFSGCRSGAEILRQRWRQYDPSGGVDYLELDRAIWGFVTAELNARAPTYPIPDPVDALEQAVATYGSLRTQFARLGVDLPPPPREPAGPEDLLWMDNVEVLPVVDYFKDWGVTLDDWLLSAAGRPVNGAVGLLITGTRDVVLFTTSPYANEKVPEEPIQWELNDRRLLIQCPQGTIPRLVSSLAGPFGCLAVGYGLLDLDTGRLPDDVLELGSRVERTPIVPIPGTTNAVSLAILEHLVRLGTPWIAVTDNNSHLATLAAPLMNGEAFLHIDVASGFFPRLELSGVPLAGNIIQLLRLAPGVQSPVRRRVADLDHTLLGSLNDAGHPQVTLLDRLGGFVAPQDAARLRS